MGEVVHDEACAGACCFDDARVCGGRDTVLVGVVVDYAGDSRGVDGAEGLEVRAVQRVVVYEDP